MAAAPVEDLDVSLPSDRGRDTTEVEETTHAEDITFSPTAGVGEVQVSLRNLFQHPDAQAIVLDIALLRQYGPEWFEWEAETVELKIYADFKQQVSALNMHKIQAAKTLHLSERFWSDWEIFVWCCMPFNGIAPDFEIMQVPTVAQAMVAVDVANFIRTGVDWSSELNDYLEQVHMHDGIFCPTDPLEWVTMDDIDDYPVDAAAVKKAWPGVEESGTAPSDDTVEAEQLRRMLAVHVFLEEHRITLSRQMELFNHA